VASCSPSAPSSARVNVVMRPTLRGRADKGVGRNAVSTDQRPVIPSCASIHSHVDYDRGGPPWVLGRAVAQGTWVDTTLLREVSSTLSVKTSDRA
jgi:hypothetical protein